MTKHLFVAAVLLAAWTSGAQLSDGVVREAFERIDPAMGLVEFSVDVTNPNTGERSKHDRNALGIVVSRDGLVLTHGHMAVENSEPFNVTVKLGKGAAEKEYEAEVLPKPEDVNVVLLKLKSDTPLDLPHVTFSGDDVLQPGQSVAVFGVLPESLDFETCVQERRVGAVLEKPRTTYVMDDAVRFGFVGGPVVNGRGQVVGVVGFDLSAQEGGELYVRSGHPLIFHTSLFQQYLTKPPVEQAEDTSGDAWLGVFTQPLSDDFKEYWGLEIEGGLVVSTVVAASPAGQAGLRPGDVITDFNGTPIRARLDRDVLGFTKLVRETGAGKTVTVTFLRDKQPQTISLTLGVRPTTAENAAEFEDKQLGLTVREITADVRLQMNLADDVQGVIVRRVESGSAAQLAKIRPGVILLAFGDSPVRNLEEYQAVAAQLAVDKPAEITVFARAGAATGFFRVQPRW